MSEQLSRDIVVLPNSGVRSDRKNILRWCRKVNSAGGESRRRVGGVVTVYESEEGAPDGMSSKRFLKSVASGEIRRFPVDPSDEDTLYEVYEWAREEIMCALQAEVDVLFIDEIGPEVIHGEALDSALRACLWKAGEEKTKTVFVIIVDRSLMSMFCNLYGVSRKDSFVKLSSFREFLKWESSPQQKQRGALRTFSWNPNHEMSNSMNVSLDESFAEEEQETNDEYKHHGQGPFYSFVRFPLLALSLGIVLTELSWYAIVRQVVNVIENLFRSNRAVHKQLATATHYTSWRRAARQLDVLENKASGSVGHVPTILQFCKSLERLTRQLVLEKRQAQLRDKEGGPPTLHLTQGDDHQLSGGSDSENGESSAFSNGAEHELLSCLRACTTTLVELVNEHLYSMNYVGTNLQMKQCIENYITAVEEVELTVEPDLLHFREWDLIKSSIERQTVSTNPGSENVLDAAQSALGGLQNRLWKTPMRATIAALRNSPGLINSPTGKSILAKLKAFEAEYTEEQQKEKNVGSPTGEIEEPYESANPHSLETSEVEKDQGGENGSMTHEDNTLEKVDSNTSSVSSVSMVSREMMVNKRALSPDDKRRQLMIALQQCKVRFFSELAHAYGETALCFSGGAGNAYYHLGVVKTLLERNCLPAHFTGASGGALIGSFVCTRTDDELREDLREEHLHKVFDPCSAGYLGMLRHLVEEGTLFNVDDWINKMVTKVCGTMTFQEAYEKTGRSLTITVYNIDAKGRNHTRVLNHKVTPNVVIYSAVLASSALPKLLPPIELLRKDARGNITEYHSLGKFWRDGSFENELPFEALRQLFNVTFPIVSQVEPHISPFFYDNRGAAGKSVAHRGGRGWRGGFMLSYFERWLKLDIKKWLELVRDFNLLPKVMETDISSIFLGRTRGACTLVPPIMVSSYVNLVADPNTPVKIRRYLRVGQQMAWPKLNMIQDRLRIERKLHELAF